MKDIRTVASSMGFAVREFRCMPHHLSGYMFLDLETNLQDKLKANKLISLNPRLDEFIKRYAIAYSIGMYHILKGNCENTAVYINNESNDERGINFAEQVLIDSNRFAEEYKKHKNMQEIEIIRALSKVFKVPQYCIRDKIKDLC